MGQPTDFPTRRIQHRDAAALADFYKRLSAETKRRFDPLHDQDLGNACRNIVQCNGEGAGTRYDIVALSDERIVGWSFLDKIKSCVPEFGFAVADEFRGRGIGSLLLNQAMEAAARLSLERASLIVLEGNTRAQQMYERRGFVKRGARPFRNTRDGRMYFGMDWCPPGGGRGT